MFFLSCKPFVVNTTFSTGVVGVKVTSVSWLGQLAVAVEGPESEISDWLKSLKSEKTGL